VAVLLAGLAGCSGGDDSTDDSSTGGNSTGGNDDSGITSEQITIDQVPRDSDGSPNYSSLNCGQLAFLAQKYDSIADGSAGMAADNDGLAMQVMQARQRVMKIVGVMGSKSCPDIPDLN
jgi:hypothetical protein